MAQKVSNETRAAVVAALCAGQSVTEVAKTYKLGKSTVCGYKRTIAPEMIRNLEEQKGINIANLLAGYLEASLAALSKQFVVLGDTEYLKKQPAGELGVLHGVLVDKAVRLIEAMQFADDAPEENATEDSPTGE